MFFLFLFLSFPQRRRQRLNFWLAIWSRRTGDRWRRDRSRSWKQAVRHGLGHEQIPSSKHRGTGKAKCWWLVRQQGPHGSPFRSLDWVCKQVSQAAVASPSRALRRGRTAIGAARACSFSHRRNSNRLEGGRGATASSRQHWWCQ